MGILDGQAVSAAITNPAFINKNIDDIMPNVLGFTNPSSGPSIADIQQAVNNIYTATGVSEVMSGTDYNATPGTITNGQNYQTALGILAGKFDPATGHFHTGAAGDGPLLNVVRSINIFPSVSGGPFGDYVLEAGSNISLTPTVNGVIIAASGGGGGGVTSIAASGNAGITGAAVLVGGTGVTLSQAGQNITIAATGGFLPPTIQTFTSGSGTYTTPSPTPLYLRVRMAGGGGGGGGGASSTSLDAGVGGNGGNTTFGTLLLVTNGGIGGLANGGYPGALGGTASISSPAVGQAYMGQSGGCGQTAQNEYSYGGNGGSTFFSGGACLTGPFGAGAAGTPNTGSGGAGGGVGGQSNNTAGVGGGSGGYLEAFIYSPSSTYSYSVGAGGTAGTAGTNGFAGGSGANGVIIVEEYYQ